MPGEWLPWEDRGYLQSIYKEGEGLGICMATPDLMPQKKSQRNHAYAMMKQMNKEACRAIAVQDGNYIGKTATTDASIVQNKVPQLYKYATENLNVHIIFWVKQEPYFTKYVIPFLEANHK